MIKEAGGEVPDRASLEEKLKIDAGGFPTSMYL
jgi:hypothetical protein